MVSESKSIYASVTDISDSGLLDFDEKKARSGVILGTNPYSDKALLSDSMDNVFVLALSRSGKGVNTVIPSALVWQDSMFCLDIGSHIWDSTASYRKDKLGQKVIKFSPLSREDTASWNPLAEIRFGTPDEFTDAIMVAKLMTGIEIDHSKDFDSFWTNSSVSLLAGVFLHLYYAHKKEGKSFPNLHDVVTLLCNPHFNSSDLYDYILEYSHITPDEFLSKENPLEKLYGDYIKDWTPFNKALKKYLYIGPVHSIEALKSVLLNLKEQNKSEVIWKDPPFSRLLLHPKVGETIGFFCNNAENTRDSILSTVRMMLLLYENPTIQKNTKFSDFCIRDLKDPNKAVSVYFCCEPPDMPMLAPLACLFVNLLCYKLVRGKQIPNPKTKKLRHLLLLLDNFTEMGHCNSLETALSFSHNYGFRFCLTTSGMHPIRKVYGENQSIVSGCSIRVLLPSSSEDISDNIFLENPMIVQFCGHKPIRAKKFLYYEHKWFMDRIQDPPELSDTGTRITKFENHAAISAIDF